MPAQDSADKHNSLLCPDISGVTVAGITTDLSLITDPGLSDMLEVCEELSLAPCDLFGLMPGDCFDIGTEDDPESDIDSDMGCVADGVGYLNGGFTVVKSMITWFTDFKPAARAAGTSVVLSKDYTDPELGVAQLGCSDAVTTLPTVQCTSDNVLCRHSHDAGTVETSPDRPGVGNDLASTSSTLVGNGLVLTHPVVTCPFPLI